MSLDVVIRGGLVVDGSGAGAAAADVGIHAGRITAVGDVPDQGATEVDAHGLVVAPGFVDIHTHYDAQVLWDPLLTPSCFHGITTVVAGNCGFGIAPARPGHRGLLARTLEHVEGMSLEALEAGIAWEFESFAGYLDAVDRRGVALNFAAYAGHTPLRIWVMGADAYEREATAAEIARMAQALAEAMDAGAAGFATSQSPGHVGDGGRPVPSRLASTEELRALLAQAGAEQHGVVGIVPGDQLPHAELYALQPEVGRPVTWTALLTYPDGRQERMLDIHRQGSATGADVRPQVSVRPLSMQCRMDRPFFFDGRPSFAALHQQAPEERIRRYGDRVWREQAQAELDAGVPRIRWDSFVVEETRQAHLEGRPLGAIAAERGSTPLDALLDIALADDLTTRVRCVIANDDVAGIGRLLGEPGTVVGLSDAGAHASQLCDAGFSSELLGTFVRERNELSLEAAVRKLTGEPADLFGFGDRGYLRPGSAADLVVFDLATIGVGPLRRVHDLPAGADRLVADRPAGVHDVLVNGRFLVRDGCLDVDARSGVVLRSART